MNERGPGRLLTEDVEFAREPRTFVAFSFLGGTAVVAVAAG